MIFCLLVSSDKNITLPIDIERMEFNIFSGEDKLSEINGFNFKILNEKHPGDKEKLSEFKQFLLDENNPMAPMNVWQLQDLSLQTAAR